MPRGLRRQTPLCRAPRLRGRDAAAPGVCCEGRSLGLCAVSEPCDAVPRSVIGEDPGGPGTWAPAHSAGAMAPACHVSRRSDSGASALLALRGGRRALALWARESGGGSRSPPDRGAALTPRQGAPLPWCLSAAHSPIVKMLAESRRVPDATAAGPRPGLLPLSGQEARHDPPSALQPQAAGRAPGAGGKPSPGPAWGRSPEDNLGCSAHPEGRPGLFKETREHLPLAKQAQFLLSLIYW